jgi:hypothetical protein
MYRAEYEAVPFHYSPHKEGQQEIAIEFTEWVIRSDWNRYARGWTKKRNNITEEDIHSTEELYTLFLQSK